LFQNCFHVAFSNTGDDGAYPQWERAVSNLLFFRRSFGYRSAAVEMLRKARAMPVGSERRAARQLARALKELANTEAWLEGPTSRLRPVRCSREHRRSAVS
jgi:hypothetical protein